MSLISNAELLYMQIPWWWFCKNKTRQNKMWLPFTLICVYLNALHLIIIKVSHLQLQRRAQNIIKH